MSMESSKHNCDCQYCEYVELQKSMTILPIKSPSINNVNKRRESDKSTIESVVSSKFSASASFEDSPIFRQWNGLLVVLRFLGSCPLSHKRGNEYRKSQVIFKWISWTSVYTLAVDIFRIVISLWYYRDWGHLVIGRKFKNTLGDWILRSMQYSMPLYHIWDILMIWAMGGKAAKLCNAWINFHLLFQTTFVGERTEDWGHRNWNWMKGILMATTIVGVTTVIFRELFFGDSSNEFRISHFVRIPPAILFMSITILDEVKILLMYFIAAASFRKIRCAIEEDLKGLENSTITSQIVASWTKNLLAARSLVKLTGQFQTPLLIPVFFHTTIMFTGVLFFAIQAMMTGRESKHTVIFGIIAGSYTIRLILKIIMAENIFLEEESVVDLLVKTDAGIFDMNGKFELSRIIQTLERKPSKISLSGYITVEKKLITKILGQIVAFLVILIQFDLGYYGNNRNATYSCANKTIPDLK